MPKGIPNNGINKGWFKRNFNTEYIKYKCHKCGKEFLGCNYLKRKFCSYQCYWKNKIGEKTNENHHNWKGGKPKCIDCGKLLVSYYSKRCSDCYIKSITGEKSPCFKGGYENHLWHNRQRRIKKLNAEGSHTFEEWEELKKKYNYMCLCCKQFEPKITLSEDHIIPLSLKGTDNIENIQPLCRNCNSRKYNKIINYFPKMEIAKNL